MKYSRFLIYSIALCFTLVISCKKDDGPKSNNGLLVALHLPQLEIQFDEDPINHNMHITSDGDYYYTINGGNIANGMINKFDLDGNLLTTYEVAIDGRGLSYNKSDNFLYASVFPGDIVKITDLENGTFQTLYTDKMQNSQGSFALSDDGSIFYDFYNGTLKVYDLSNGNLLTTLVGLSSGSSNYGGNAAVAVDPDYIYTWDANTREVFVYNHSGILQSTFTLDHGDNGHSLSFIDGYLFVSDDGDYAIGTWYGYNIRRNMAKSAIVKSSSSKSNRTIIKPDDSTIR